MLSFPDPRKSGLVRLVLQVCMGQLTGQQKDMLVRQLTADIQVQKIQAHSGLRCEPHTSPASCRSFPLLLLSCLHALVPRSYALFLQGQQ